VKTFYALTEGEYSDHCVLAVFDDRAAAERWKAAMEQQNDDGFRRDLNDIEELTFVDQADVPHSERIFSAYAEVFPERVHRREGVHSTWFDYPPKVRPSVRLWTSAYMDGRGIQIDVQGATREAVTQAMNAAIAQHQGKLTIASSFDPGE
jgi:hypothetical protein